MTQNTKKTKSSVVFEYGEPNGVRVDVVILPGRTEEHTWTIPINADSVRSAGMTCRNCKHRFVALGNETMCSSTKFHNMIAGSGSGMHDVFVPDDFGCLFWEQRPLPEDVT